MCLIRHALYNSRYPILFFKLFAFASWYIIGMSQVEGIGSMNAWIKRIFTPKQGWSSCKKALELVVTDFIVSTQRDIPDPGIIDSPDQTVMIRINSPPPGELYYGGEFDAHELSPICTLHCFSLSTSPDLPQASLDEWPVIQGIGSVIWSFILQLLRYPGPFSFTLFITAIRHGLCHWIAGWNLPTERPSCAQHTGPGSKFKSAVCSSRHRAA